MVTIYTSDDILRALAENPEWKEAVRREILTEQLLNLPARFDQFVDEQRQFNDEQRERNVRMDQFVDEQRQFNDEQRERNVRMDQFVDEQRQFNDHVGEFMHRTDLRFSRIEADISNMRGDYARNTAASEAEDIASAMGFQMVRTLTDDDKRELLRTSDTTGIATPELQSFRRADLIIETTDGDGATHYIAVEVSNQADERDTRRAIRNAGFLTRFTGHPAHAAIASVRNDYRIQDTIDSGQVYCHELEDRDPTPE